MSRERYRLDEPADGGSTLKLLFDFSTVAVVVGAIVVLPWMFGGVYASSQLLLAGSAFVGIAVWLAMSNERPRTIPFMLVPLLLAVALGVVQLLPLARPLATRLSPRAVELWETSAPQGKSFAIAVGDPGTSSNTTLSVYPASTRRDLALLAVAVGVFYAGSQIVSRRKWHRLVFAVVAVNGALFAFFGIAQQLAWNGKLYGRVPLTEGGSPFAAFVNRNNAGGYLNLCFAAAIGFALYAFVERRRAKTTTSEFTPRHRSSLWSDSRHTVVRQLAGVNGQKTLALSMIVVIFAAVVCSLSRGAWLSMLVAGSVVGVTLAKTKRTTYVVWMLLAVGLGAVLVGWLGRTEAVTARWNSLEQQVVSPTDVRLSNWGDGLRASGDFWLLGSGLGTYRYIYRPYTDSAQTAWFYHAENQYIEALCEAGVVGLGLMLIALASVALASWQLLRSEAEPQRRICGIVGVYAVISQAVHACFDFGLYLPANMALFALLCGMVAGCATTTHTHLRRWGALIAPIELKHGLRTALASSVLCAMLVGMWELGEVNAVEVARRESRMTGSGADSSLLAASRNIEQLSRAVSLRPDDAEAQFHLAELWIHRYRLRSLEEFRTRSSDIHAALQWQLTSPLAVHRAALGYARDGRAIELENLRRADAVRTDLQHAARHLSQALRGSPVLARPRLRLAEIGPVVSPLVSDGDLLAHMEELAGGRFDLLREAGLAHLQAGRVDRGLADFRRVLELEPSQLNSLLRLASPFVGPEELVNSIAPRSPHQLIKLAGERFSGTGQEAMRLELLKRANELMKVDSPEQPDRLQLEGTIYALEAKQDKAIECLRQAVAGRPEMTAWRFELAALLKKQGDIEQAWEHARICSRREPDNEQFDALLEQLVRARVSH